MITTLFEALCSNLNVDWSDIENNDLYNEIELTRWLTLAKDLAYARHPWPMTEGRREIATVAGQEQYDYVTDMKSDSIIYLTVNDKRYQKLLFEDYMKYKEDYDTGAEKYFTDRNRDIYINYLAQDFGNSIVCYCQVEVTGTISSTVSSTVFTAAEPEADEAIVKLAFSMALGSEKEKNPTKARIERTEALGILDDIWLKIAEQQHQYQTKDRPLFKRFNVLEGGYESEIRSRKQF